MAGNGRNRKAHPLPSGDLDPVAALAVLRAEVENKAEVPEPGYRTAQEWSEAWDISPGHTMILLKRGVKSGIVGERYFRIKTGLIVRRVRHFRVIRKAVRG